MMIVNVKMGLRVKIFHPKLVNLFDCFINDDTTISPFVEIGKGVEIGKRCKIGSHSYICMGVIIKDDVFIGHGVMFTNDRYPKVSGDWKLEETVVEDDVSIGSGSTILCGITLGRGCLIGAGSVVTKDVPCGVVVVGNPACVVGRVKV